MLALALLALPSPAAAAFGFESVSSTFSRAGGVIGAMPAGSHPESWRTTLAFNATGPPGEQRPEGALKDLHVELPVGLVAVPTLVPHCSHLSFLAEACPASSAVGSIAFVVGEALPPSTLYLLEPISGQTAELGFHAQGIPVTFDVSISPQPPHRLIVSTTNVSQVAELLGATLTLEGTPNGVDFLTLPRSCTEPLRTGFAASSWQDPTAAVLASSPEPQALVGCGSLPYAPSLRVTPTTSDIASPSGIAVTFDAPDEGLSSITGRATADTRSASLTLPPGLAINPSVAIGVAACTPAQIAAEAPTSESGQGCPEASQLGTATVTTPLFPKPISGDIYLTEPDGASSAVSGGPSGTRFALALVLRDAERGVLLSLPVQVDADHDTGRLSASLEQIPQLPVSHVELRFNSGPRAPLVTPATCGTHAIAYSLAPSSGNSPLTGSDSFTVTSSECDSHFAPSLSAGTVSNAAGRSAGFVFELGQGAAGPNLSGAAITLPPGLSASFAAASPCPESQVGSGDCPGGSKLGYARIAVGAGPEPLWIPAGEDPDSAVYLAGPYKGAPYSLLIVVPGKAGPFDLGTVILRAPITVDPITAQAGVSIEGLPQILAGVPLHYRTVRVVLDRPGFIRNPTNCEPTEITGTARAADGDSAALTSRFQAVDCAALAFRPKLSLKLSGAHGRNGHPGLRAKLRTDPEGAALKSARFALPRGELLDLKHVRALCPRAAAVAGCPAASRLGSIRLYSPSLESPLEGPIYLRVPSHRLPDLVAEVRAGGLRFLLHGRTTDAKGRVGVVLQALPDVPLSGAVLSLPGGRRGIVVNSRSLCRKRGAANAVFGAHNGRRRRLRVPVRVGGCH